jgi:hypothetical protein
MAIKRLTHMLRVAVLAGLLIHILPGITQAQGRMAKFTSVAQFQHMAE